MEEKRRVEKLLLADIEAAQSNYEASRATQRNSVADETLRKPPVIVKIALATYCKAQQQATEATKIIEDAGFSVVKDGNGYVLRLAYYTGSKARPLAEFDRETKKMQSAFTEVKRAYTLKLFAGGEEAQQLFASLAAELEKLTK